MGQDVATSGGDRRPPRVPPIKLAVLPPARPRRNRRRPATPRRQLAPPRLRDHTSTRPILLAAEADLIDEWQHARRTGDLSRSAELSQFLWTANRSLAERAARRLPRLTPDDARQTAALALFRALEGFDSSPPTPRTGLTRKAGPPKPQARSASPYLHTSCVR